MVTRKNVRILILLACGIALVLASSGCKKKEEEPAEPNVTVPGTEPKVTVPGTEPKVTVPGTEPKVTVPGTEPKVTVPGTAKTLVVEPLVGIDKVRFGMTVEEMKQVLGEPQRTRVPLHEYRDFGFAIFAINNAVTMVACGSRRSSDSPLIKNCKVRTGKGIGMGSSKEDVISSYGQPSSTQQLPGVSNAVLLRYDQLSSEFLLRDDKVTYMMFRAEGFGGGTGGLRTPRPGSM